MKYPIECSCQCGQAGYKLHKSPKMVFACHCTECQKLSTSPFSVTAVADINDVEFSGELKEWHRIADSGNKNYAKFCPECGNRIYHFNPDDLSTVKLKLNPVDKEGSNVFNPTVHVWVSSKKSWYEIPGGVKVIDKQPKPGK